MLFSFSNTVSGLLSLMYVEGIARVLHITNRSSTAPLSFSRYLSTLNHTLSWYRGVPEMLKSAARVRVLHRQAATVREDVMVTFTDKRDLCLDLWKTKIKSS